MLSVTPAQTKRPFDVLRDTTRCASRMHITVIQIHTSDWPSLCRGRRALVAWRLDAMCVQSGSHGMPLCMVIMSVSLTFGCRAVVSYLHCSGVSS